MAGSQNNFDTIGNNEKDVESTSTISIDSSQIPVVPLANEFSGSTLENLSRLGVQTYNPDEVEKSILNQIDVAMAKEDEAARQKLAALKKEISDIQKLVKNTVIPDLAPNASQDDKEVVEGMQLARAIKLRKLDDLQKQEAKLAREIRNRRNAQKSQNGKAALNFGLEDETENDRLIREGKITPFEVAMNENKEREKETEKTKTTKSKKTTTTTTTTTTSSTSSTSPSSSSTSSSTSFTPPAYVPQPPQRRAAMKRKVQEEEWESEEEKGESDEEYTGGGKKKKQERKRLRKRGGKQDGGEGDKKGSSEEENTGEKKKGRRKASKKKDGEGKGGVEEEEGEESDKKGSSDEDYKLPIAAQVASSSEESDEIIDDDEILGSVGEDEDVPVKRSKFKMEGDSWVDDGNENLFQKRLQEFMRIRWLNKMEKKKENGEEVPENMEDVEIADEEIDEDDVEFGAGMKVPREMYDNLFEYQKTGVRWMWELHCQNAGGIIGDEMGLGKTVQTICFLGSLHHSKLLDGPCIVICPATLMTQWVREFHTWWPPFRVALLHGSGTHTGPRAEIISTIAKKGHILITTYEGIRINQEELLKHRWEYIVMDEGHKIRNPDAEITITCKKFPTTHRLILTGAPIQNNLTELWSLFDFVFPGRLGTLPIFQAQFEVPISLGGYANATPVQVQTAYKCAVALRDLINPYMLRRMKADVLKSLPKKTEQVLFCQLTDAQSEEYRNFLRSQEVQQVLDGRRHLLYAIDWMRKICNHPDLLHRDSSERPGDYGNWERSGKLRVVEQILPMWRQQGHKVLLFCQTRQMLDIVESFVREKEYKFLRLDGMTAIKQRMALVDTFNNDPTYFIFILTTKVGGLGINLVGADRVLLFDPDWNPSTDVQARERVWRIGQKRDVTIYRLITSGTIEEKIYHRQIFKEFLTNKILKDPRQKRFFKSKNLHDLFTLGDYHKRSETSDIFAGLNPDVRPEHDEEEGKEEEQGRDAMKTEEESDDEESVERSRSRKKTKDDMKILRALFNGEGLKGAVKHDAIVDQSNPEHIIVEYEANRIAEKAVEALRRSRQSIQRQRADAGTPTWTGRSGQAGAPVKKPNTTPTPKPRFGSQSSSLLATLSSPSPSSSKPPNPTSSIVSSATAIPSTNTVRNFGQKGKDGVRESLKEKVAEKEKAAMGEVGFANAAPAPLSSQDLLQKLRQGGGTAGKRTTFGDGTAVNVIGGANMERTLSAVLDFLIAEGGSATTQAIVDKFKFSTSPEDAPVFRGLLRRIATFDQQARTWVVKPEWVAE